MKNASQGQRLGIMCID